MKNVGLLLALSLIVGGQTFAASNKVCFGSRNNDETKGVTMTAKITKKTVTLKTLREGNGNPYNGTYPTYGTTVKGRDGHVYLEYKGESSDYQDVIMIDEALLKSGTTGLIQIRARGEGFFNNVFVCRDNQRQ
jgi:hypothetical protein